MGVLALGPALRRGFLLSYDMVLVPREPFSAALSGLTSGAPRAVPSDVVVAALSRAVPADVLQKLVLLAIFALACSGAVALLGREPWPARLAAGVYYTWNPFVAERLLIGQWALLLGYAGLPWVLRAVVAMSAPSWRGTGRLSLALLPAVVGGFAAMSITALVLVPAALFGRVPGQPTGRAETSCARRAQAVAVAVGLLVVGSLPWLVPAVLHSQYADPAGGALFAAGADTPFGAFGSVAMLGGAWNSQTVPAGYGGAWSVVWLAAMAIALAAYVAGARARRWPGLTFAGLAGLAIASIGLTTPGQHLLRAATSLWPGFAVLRDGQQFVAPLALAEAVGYGLAVAWWLRRGGQRAAHPPQIHDHVDFSVIGTEIPSGSWRPERQAGVRGVVGHQSRSGAGCGRPNGADTGCDRPNGADNSKRRRGDLPGVAAGVMAILAPLLLLPGLSWGAGGRLRPAWYPADWLAVARMVNADPARGAVLLLPWTAYRDPAWNGRRTVLDPWPRLLSRPVVWNDGGLVGRVQLAPDDPRARRLDRLVRSSAPLTAALQAAGVRFVIVDAGTAPRPRLPGCTVLAPGGSVLVPGGPGAATTLPGLVVYRVPPAA
ncbi:MAG TPA: hypothetical protein VGS19_13580 [Streptosporangiaceae bacterium]|nr:hypothetical protein [Streptosporangiaceae bacterium]